MKVLSSVVNLLFPTRCVVCGLLHDSPLCPACAADLPYTSGHLCGCCGTTLAHKTDACDSCIAIIGDSASEQPLAGTTGTLARNLGSGDAASDGEADRACRYTWTCRSLMVFERTGRDVIHALKYSNGRRLASVLAEAVAERIDRAFLDVDVLTYVPLHPARRAERGYNQSLLVARALGKLIGVPIAHALRQVRRTADQAQLSAEERRANVREAYDSTGGSAVCRGRRVLLIDDVLTTGATARECAAVLLRAGAAEVRVVTLARAPLD